MLLRCVGLGERLKRGCFRKSVRHTNLFDFGGVRSRTLRAGRVCRLLSFYFFGAAIRLLKRFETDRLSRNSRTNLNCFLVAERRAAGERAAARLCNSPGDILWVRSMDLGTARGNTLERWQGSAVRSTRCMLEGFSDRQVAGGKPRMGLVFADRLYVRRFQFEPIRHWQGLPWKILQKQISSALQKPAVSELQIPSVLDSAEKS